MKLKDAAIMIATDHSLTIEAIEGIISKVIEDATAARECCSYRVHAERKFWETMCESNVYWLGMAAIKCNQQGYTHDAEKRIFAAAAVEKLLKDRKERVYAAYGERGSA